MSHWAPKRVRYGALLVLLLLAGAAVAALAPSRSDSQTAVTSGPLPFLGAADSEMVLMGAAPQGAAGEVWGYRRLPLTIGSVVANGRPLEFGFPGADPEQPTPQLAFLRHTDATGWQVFQTPVDEAGNPYRGPIPNRLSARTTPTGGGVLVGRDTGRPSGSQTTVLHRSAGGRYRALEAPPTSVLQSGEALAEDQGSGSVALAAIDENSSTGLFFGPVGRAVEDAIIHYDGNSWSREPVEVPAGSGAEFRIVALGATSPGNAWALARTDPALGRGIVLFQRTTAGGAPRWVERSLGDSPFAAAATPSRGVSGVEALGGAAQPLTVTSDGVWIDGSLESGGAQREFTVFFDPDSGSGAVTGSFCDVAICSSPLGVQLARGSGYRSFAWAGAGLGTRVITNPLDVDGDDRTNRGTYLRLDSGNFVRRPGGGGNFRASGAFANDNDGWLEGPVQISAAKPPNRLRSWPVSLRAPLTDVTPQPGTSPAALGSRALAAGLDGSIARYFPGSGWKREFLFSSSGSVAKSSLRGVAWPETSRAHAVGDLGAMWQWNADSDLWEPDPATPIGFEGNLMDVAFEPGDPDRGYAVGKSGVLLRYGKTWDQETLPPGFDAANFTQVAFAGRQAIVVSEGDLLLNDGGEWRVDQSARALLNRVRAGRPQLFSVAGLPDGGAVAAGRDFVIERDGPTSPWRFSDQPLPGSTVIAAAGQRSGGRVRAIVSVVPQVPYPAAEDLPEPDPNSPPPIIPPFSLPPDGYILRETASGWTDEQRTSFGGSGADRPFKSDPISSFLLDGNGNGWVVGGWSGEADAAGRGSSARNPSGRATRVRVRTAGIYRFGADAGTPPAAAGAAPVGVPPGPVRLAVAGHAQCEQPCADLAPQGIGPDRTLTSALERVARIAGGNGPRALLYTGGRSKAGLNAREAGRYAELLGSRPELPVYSALGAGDSAGNAVAYRNALASFPAPLGTGPPPSGVSSAGIPGAAAGPGARTHYAFDTAGAGGRLRVVVIDNSLGSLAASDPYQNPAEPQRPWLAGVLADAKAGGIPVVVMGSRELNSRSQPRLNPAADGDDVARLLVEGGASAYVFDRPEENRTSRVPAGAAQTIPAFGSGTLGYRSPIVGGISSTRPDSLFGDSGFLLLEVDATKLDSATNRAPVSARLIPVIEDLSLEATDGTLLRRSRPSLFRGLGRRPRAGDRWGRAGAGDGNPDPPGGDPYTPFPPDQCLIAGCSTRVTPEYEFTSSDDDIADFVRQDPNSSNLRKPFLDAKDKVVSSSASGLLCPFNAGTTTVTVRAGGFSFSERIRVQKGSVQRPCGTRPLKPDRFKKSVIPTPVAPPPPVDPAPANDPPPNFPPPEPPPASVPPAVPPVPVVPPALRLNPPRLSIPPVPGLELPFLAAQTTSAANVPTPPPPPPPVAARPPPPGGVAARVAQVEKEREEEAAPEQSQAFSRYQPEEDSGLPPYLLGLVLIAAVAGASVRGAGGPRSRRPPAPVGNAGSPYDQEGERLPW